MDVSRQRKIWGLDEELVHTYIGHKGSMMLFGSVGDFVDDVIDTLQLEFPELTELRSWQITPRRVESWSHTPHIIHGGAGLHTSAHTVLQHLRNLVMYGGVAGSLEEAERLLALLAPISIDLYWDGDQRQHRGALTSTAETIQQARCLGDWDEVHSETLGMGLERGVFMGSIGDETLKVGH